MLRRKWKKMSWSLRVNRERDANRFLNVSCFIPMPRLGKAPDLLLLEWNKRLHFETA
jgi:hypothetical protein